MPLTTPTGGVSAQVDQLMHTQSKEKADEVWRRRQVRPQGCSNPGDWEVIIGSQLGYVMTVSVITGTFLTRGERPELPLSLPLGAS